MTASFEEHADGRIYVRTPGLTYCDTRANFEADFGQPPPALELPIVQRIYVPGVRHALGGAEGVLAGGEMPWAFGDAAIAAVDDIVEAQNLRNAPLPPSPEQLQDAARAAIDAVRNARLAAGFVDAGETDKIYQCDPNAMTNWTALASAAGFALTLGSVPLPTFTLITFDNSTIELDAEDLFALMTQRVMPWVSATYFHARTLKDQVLSETPPADITAGWP